VNCSGTRCGFSLLAREIGRWYRWYVGRLVCKHGTQAVDSELGMPVYLSLHSDTRGITGRELVKLTGSKYAVHVKTVPDTERGHSAKEARCWFAITLLGRLVQSPPCPKFTPGRVKHIPLFKIARRYPQKRDDPSH